MGKAIVIPGIAFDVNLGKVTINGEQPSVVEITGLSIASKPSTIQDSAQLSVSYTPSDTTQKGVTWRSSDETIATVSSSGYVTVKKSGNVTITATSTYKTQLSDSFTASCSISQTRIPVTSIQIAGNTTGKTGESIQLSASVLPANATNKGVTWQSSNETIASVNSSGLVTLKAAGNATITATSASDSNITASHSVTISESTVISGTKAILSFTRLTEGVDYETLSNGDLINVVFPNGTNGGKNQQIKSIDNNTFCQLIHNKSQYPSGEYTWKDFSYLNNTLSGDTGAYPDKYFIRASNTTGAVTPTRGLMYLSDIANGNYNIKIYACTPVANAYDSSRWNNIIYQVNDSPATALSFNTGNNVTDYVEIEASVTDNTMSIMTYINNTGIYNAPALCIVEITKV